MLTYVGMGYSKAFVANYDVIVARLNEGEDIWIVDGPDDICHPLRDDADQHCLNQSIVKRDRHARRSLTDLLSRPVARGDTITLDDQLLRQLRDGFASGLVRKACVRCEWSALCTKVAEGDFETARLGAAVDAPA